MKNYKSKFSESTQNLDDGMTDEEAEGYRQQKEVEYDDPMGNLSMYESYKSLFEAKVDTGIDEDDYIEKMESRYPSFVSLSLSDDERKQLVKMHSSKKYNWKFVIHSTETEKEKESSENKIRELKKQGWKVFMDDDNIDQRALAFYKKK